MNGTLSKESSFVKNRAKLFACKSEEEVEVKTPSYVSLSCAVSGYSGLNRYDSRARQEISRSRDSSRDGMCLSPNHIIRNEYILTDLPVPSPAVAAGRSKSVDRGYLRQNFLNLQNKPPTEDRGRVRIRSSTVPHQDSKSVIQQRIERLYGPAALAGGFFLVKSPLKSNKEPLKSFPINNNNNTKETTDGCATPPVFRHLNAEFRQQLKLKNKRSSPVIAVSPPAQKPIKAEIPLPESAKTIIDDGHKFLKILDDERKRIECLIAKNELYLLESAVQSSEELTGKLRAAVGKGKLLVAQKFEQFAGLCRKNLTQSPNEPFPTTGQDLAGFWDMVTIQVEHIKLLFAEIHQLRENNWVEVEPKELAAPKVVKNKSRPTSATPSRSAKAEEAAKAREDARKKMLEDRRRMAKAKKNEDWVIIEGSEKISYEADEHQAII